MSEKYTKFFKKMKQFKQEQEKQKQRGLNDYNILTTVLKYHDEVRVHSRMIGSFLDVNGAHYQKDLFLNLFLKTLCIENYNSENSQIHLEYENIDLYLTDGTKHIIIENKIWAEDQKNQIQRYIEIIQKENKELTSENLYVVYLSIDREKPSEYSMGDLKIEDGLVKKDGNEIACYKNMWYKTDILKWLEKCQYQVQNITNLNIAVTEYISVVKMITKQYKGNVVSILEFIKTEVSSDEQKEVIDMLDSLDKTYKKEKLKLKETYFRDTLPQDLEVLLKLDKPSDTNWLIKFSGNEKKFYKKYGVNMKIYKPDYKIVYWLSFDIDNLQNMYWAIAKTEEKIDLTDIREKFEKFKQPIRGHQKTIWSLIWNKSEYGLDENIAKIISNPKELSENIYKEFKSILISLANDYECSLEEINEFIEKSK